jgi:hypothetical protein
MVFPTSPTVGQVFTSGSRSWVWNGSAWDSPSAINVLQVPYGLEFIRATAFTAQSSVTVNNVFSATYENYFIDITLTQNTAASDSVWTLVNGGTPAASNWGHSTLGLARTGGTLATHNAGTINAVTPYFFPTNATHQLSMKINLSYPFATTRTLSITQSIASADGFGNNHAIWSNASLDNSTSYEGFRFTASAGTMTGSIKIYGYRNE